MTSTNSVLVNACGPVNGILRPTSSSVSSALAATAEMSRSTMGAVDAVAYGPLTTSPAWICGAHMPKKLVMNTVGRRLTHSRPESTASCSTSLLRSPRKRDGWREKSSSALMADSATSRVTPSRRARATSGSSSSPSARELRNTAEAPGRPSAAVPTTLTPAGKRAVSGCRVTARTSTPAVASCVTSGRPTLPVAPVTRIAFMKARTTSRREKLHNRHL